MATTTQTLSTLASHETVEYALGRSLKFERSNPMLSLVYRVVAEVLRAEVETTAEQPEAVSVG